MNPKWEVRIALGVLQDTLSRPIHPFVTAVLGEWLLGLCRLLEETAGYPANAFLVRTVVPAQLGFVFEERLVALYTHRRLRFRTWRTLWLRQHEKCEIVITWLFVLPG